MTVHRVPDIDYNRNKSRAGEVVLLLKVEHVLIFKAEISTTS